MFTEVWVFVNEPDWIWNVRRHWHYEVGMEDACGFLTDNQKQFWTLELQFLVCLYYMILYSCIGWQKNKHHQKQIKSYD